MSFILHPRFACCCALICFPFAPLPLIVGAATTAHRLGIVALAAGLALSFTVFGLVIATIGPDLGLGLDTIRDVSALLMVVVGIVLLSERVQQRFAMATARFGNAGHGLAAHASGDGLGHQLPLGVLLDAAWSPCVGPTLGAASLLAAQGRALGQVTVVMLAFGLGAALPLLLIGTLSRQAILRWRGRLMQAGKGGKRALGVLTLAIGTLILTGIDHRLETALINLTPAWLSDVTTRY